MENRLVTIMFVDMQGYTRKSAQQTVEEMKLFHDEIQAFVTKSLEQHQGNLIKSLGDGFLVRFDSPTKAVQCGLEMQRRIESRNANILNPDHLIRFRIGINTGEVGIDEKGDVFGDPVNIASRIQGFAEPNEVFISETTYMAMNRNQFGTMDLGPQNLKNATREIRIYKILKKGSPGITLSAPPLPPSGDGSVAGAISRHKPLLIGALGGAVIVVLILGLWQWGRPRSSSSRPGMTPPAGQDPSQVTRSTPGPGNRPTNPPDRDPRLPRGGMPTPGVGGPAPRPPIGFPEGDGPPPPDLGDPGQMGEGGPEGIPGGNETPSGPRRPRWPQDPASREALLQFFLDPLRVDAQNPLLPLNPHLRDQFAKVQKLYQNGDYDKVMEKLQAMEGKVKGRAALPGIRISFSMIVAELAIASKNETLAREAIRNARDAVPPLFPFKKELGIRIADLEKRIRP